MSDAFDELKAEDDFDKLAGVETAHTEKTLGHDGVVRREVHASSPDTSDPEPAPQPPGLLERAAEYLSPKTGTGALAAGVSKGATLGFGDELYGASVAGKETGPEAADALKSKVAEDVARAKQEGRYDIAPPIPKVTSYVLKRPGQPDVSSSALAKSPSDTETPGETPWTQAYQQARDSMREHYKVAEKEHPHLFTAGELAGGMAVPMPGVGKAKGLVKAGKYALMGAGAGTAAGLGGSESDLTQGDVSGALKDTGAGTLGGAVFGGALGYGASKLDPWLEQKAARSAFKALDPYMASIAKALGPDATKGEILAEAQRLGQRTLDEGIIPKGKLSRWANSENLAENAMAKTKEAGELKGATVDMAQDALGGRPANRWDHIRDVEQAAEQAGRSGNQKLKRKLLSEAADARQTIIDLAAGGHPDPAGMTLQEAEKFKTGLQGQIDYGAKLPSREAQTAVARLAKEQTERAIEKGLGPEDLEQFKAVKNRYGDLKSISDIANHGAVRSFRNNTVGLGDKIAGNAAAAAVHGPMAIPAAAATAAAHNFANHRGAAGIARTLANAAQRTSPALVPGAQLLSEGQGKWKALSGQTDEEEK